jgi:hypothetical protein
MVLLVGFLFIKSVVEWGEYLVFEKEDSFYALILRFYVFFFILFCESRLSFGVLSIMLFSL